MNALKSLPNLVPNANWASLPLFDRSGWTRVRFGDVVENVTETERSPAEVGIDRFIAMEHLEPGSLHVREWGNVAHGTTFTRRCRPGQVLFGKRRAYQRNVAVAEFDAVDRRGASAGRIRDPRCLAFTICPEGRHNLCRGREAPGCCAA